MQKILIGLIVVMAILIVVFMNLGKDKGKKEIAEKPTVQTQQVPQSDFSDTSEGDDDAPSAPMTKESFYPL